MKSGAKGNRAALRRDLEIAHGFITVCRHDHINRFDCAVECLVKFFWRQLYREIWESMVRIKHGEIMTCMCQDGEKYFFAIVMYGNPRT